MVLLIDIGNTHTHLGLANSRRVTKTANVCTDDWFSRGARGRVARFVGRARLEGVSLASVVPKATSHVRFIVEKAWHLIPLELNSGTVAEVKINYPMPETIGADRLANALAAKYHFGAPSVVVDFGTAVTFDVVDRHGEYVGGIIAPGLSAMTTYLHEKTALLPAINIREVDNVIGKSTTEAMLIGAVHGYRGLVRELLMELRKELRCPRLPVIATGGYAELIAGKLPEITSVQPDLTLEGLRLNWEHHRLRP